MNRIRKILVIAGMLMSLNILASPAGDAWLLQTTAKPLEIDFNSSRTAVVCTPSTGCQTVIVIGN